MATTKNENSTAGRIRAVIEKTPNMSAAEVADALGVSRQRVHQVCIAAGIKLPRGERRRPEPRIACAAGVPISHTVAGAIAEAIVVADLLARGCKPYTPVVRQRSHDIIAVTPSGAVVTIEVRSARRDAGKLSVPRKRSDQSQHYALVVPGESVAYYPPLP